MNFELKSWDTSYIDDVHKYANNKNIADRLRDVFPYPYTRNDAEWYINDCISKEGNNQITRAIVVDNHAVGSIGIFVQSDVYRKSAELGYWLGEEFWNKGIMTEAIKKICDMAFNQFDIVRIYAEPFEYNKGSRRVLEKSGFNLEGIFKNSVIKNDKIFNSCMYALLKD